MKFDYFGLPIACNYIPLPLIKNVACVLSLCSFHLCLLFVKMLGRFPEGSFDASPDGTTRISTQNYSSFPSWQQQSEINNVQLKPGKSDSCATVLETENQTV